MLAKFLICIVIMLILFRICTCKDIELYNVYKIFVKNKFDGKEVSITYGNNRIEFSSSKEAGEKFEALVNEALSYYDKLGVLAMHDTDFKNKRDTLINICAEVRTLRWRNEEL